MNEFLNIVGKIPYSAILLEKKCLRERSIRSECRNCELSCLRHNVTIESNRVSIGDDCVSCGACAWVCPVNAIAYPKLEEEVRIGQIYIGNFETLEIFSVNYLSYLYLKGVRVLLIDEKQKLSNAFYNNFDIFQTLLKRNSLEMMELSIFDEDRWEILKDEVEISRAEFISTLINISRQTAKAFVAKKELLRDYFLDLFPNKRENSLSFVEIGKECSKCKACIILCPRNALEIQDDKVVQIGACNGCKLCKEICPKKTIKIQNKVI